MGYSRKNHTHSSFKKEPPAVNWGFDVSGQVLLDLRNIPVTHIYTVGYVLGMKSEISLHIFLDNYGVRL